MPPVKAKRPPRARTAAPKPPAAPSAPHVALMDAYVADVISGKVLACKWIRLACERHVRDLSVAGTQAFPYVFDPAAAERVCRFAERFPHVKGRWAAKHELLVLQPWQCFIMCSIFGWKRVVTGFRRFRKARIYTTRKQGKSLLAAPIGLYMFAADGEPGAEVFSGATNEKQAWEVFGPAKQMASLTQEFVSHYGIGVNAKTMTRVADMSKFEPVIGKPGDGSSPHCAIIDEYHEHDTDAQMATMETGMGARTQPLSLVVSTAGDNLAGPCRADWLDCQKMLEGINPDEQLFCVIYTVDVEPSSFKLQSLQAIERLDKKCDCHSVPTTQMLKLLVAVCARHATQNGGELAALANAAITQIEMLVAVSSAGHATNNTCLIGTQIEKPHQSQSAKNGILEIPIELNELQIGFEQSRGIKPTSETPGLKIGMASQAESTKNGTPSKKEIAGHAENPIKFSAWITAILRDLFEGFYAENATLVSAISETVKRGYEAHSNTCSVREMTLEGSTLIETRAAPDWTSDEALRMANPNYDVSVTGEFLQAQQQQAINSPRHQGHFKTKHLNLWVQARDAFINMQRWAECLDKTLKLSDFKGRKCKLGMDLASKTDLTALELVFKLDDGRYARFGKYYLPEETVQLPENQHYRAWHAAGLLTATEGNMTDYFHVLEDIKELTTQFEIEEIAYDPHNATMLVTALQNEGLPMVEFGPTVLNFSEPMKQIEALIKDRKLLHDGDPVMEWAMSNVTAKLDRKDNIFPNKERPENKIDPFVALCMAVGRHMIGAEPEKKFQLLVF